MAKRADALQRLTGAERLKAGAGLLADMHEEACRLQALCLEVKGLLELDARL